MDFSNVNWLALLVCSVASAVVGIVYFSKPFFLTPWLKGIGKDEAFANTPRPKAIISALVLAFIEAFFVSTLIGVMGTTTLLGGLQAGFMIWLGFVAPTHLVDEAFEGRSLNFALVKIGNHLVLLLIMGAILAVWR